MEVETTAEHFEIFKAERQRWIEIYGLKGWRVYDEHGGCADDTYGECHTLLSGRVATIRLASMYPVESLTPEHLCENAFHEVTELLMARAKTLACSRGATIEQIDEAFHEIIRILENVLYPKYKLERKI